MIYFFKINAFIVILVSWGSFLYGQDPQFSQFYNNSTYYNPAAAGIESDLRLTTNYRSLWSKVPGDFKTYYLSTDYQVSGKNIGFGFLLLNDNEGYQHLLTSRAELMFSYRLQKKNSLFQFGLSVFSINVKNFLKGSLVFTDQLDPIYGNIFQSSYSGADIERLIYPDWNFGLIYRQNLKHRMMTPSLGVSFSHIFTPNISFTDNVVNLPVKYVVNGNILTQIVLGKKSIINKKIAFLNPGFIYELQKPFQTFTLGSGFNVYPFRFGLWLRNRTFMTNDMYRFNSVIVSGGLDLPIASNQSVRVEYSYDSTVSKLEFSSGGAHEITLIFDISLPKKIESVTCPPNRFYEWWKDAEPKFKLRKK